MRRSFRLTTLSLATALTFACRSSDGDLRTQSAFAIQNGLEFLAAQQTPSGGFVTERWRVDNIDPPESIDTTFTVSQVLYSLSFCSDSNAARDLRERAAVYLEAEKDSSGLWRYYGTRTPLSILPDVDDTSMALAALNRVGRPIAAAALNILRSNQNAAGQFNTWIGDPATITLPDRGDIDLVVNANALLVFALAGESVEPACRSVVDHAQSERFRDGTPYYGSAVAFTFAVSRAYADGKALCLKDSVEKLRAATLALQKEDGSWGNDLETAFGALTLLNFGYREESLARAIRAIIARQDSDGGWALATAYRGINDPVRYGSRALTTAVCVEALAKYYKR